MWVAFSSNNGLSGGLVAYQPVTTTNGTGLRTAEFNWSNAPVGSNFYYSGNWDSSLRAVGAVDERVWTGKTNGQLTTLAQRWQQLDQSDDIGSKVVEGVWLVRGRAFLATSNSLHVLMPDGKTWDNRSGVHVRAILGDSRGRIWAGTDGDVRRYTPGFEKTFFDRNASIEFRFPFASTVSSDIGLPDERASVLLAGVELVGEPSFGEQPLRTPPHHHDQDDPEDE